MKVPGSIVLGLCAFCVSVRAASTPTVARAWDEEILAAIRIDLPNPNAV